MWDQLSKQLYPLYVFCSMGTDKKKNNEIMIINIYMYTWGIFGSIKLASAEATMPLQVLPKGTIKCVNM